MELMVGGKDVVDGKDKVQRIWSKMVVGCNLARGTTDCCMANTIVNCYYWSFEVANVVADGRFSKKTMIMWL